MSLAPIPPVSRRSQWRDFLRVIDPTSGDLMNLTGFTVRIDITRADEQAFTDCSDYGRRFIGRDEPQALLSIQTTPDNTGSLIRADDYTLIFVFTRDQMLGLRPGSYCRNVMASVADEYDEVQREFFTVS